MGQELIHNETFFLPVLRDDCHIISYSLLLYVSKAFLQINKSELPLEYPK